MDAPTSASQHPDNPNNNKQTQPLFDIAELDQHPLDLRLAWARQALAAGHDVNRLDQNPHRLANFGRPLHCALREPLPDNLELIRFLIEQGADPRLRDCRNQKSATDAARECIDGYGKGSSAHGFYTQAAKLMDVAAKRLEDKEATSRGEAETRGVLSHVQRFLGLREPKLPSEKPGKQQQQQQQEVQGGEKNQAAHDLPVECAFCRERKRHNWHYFCYKGTSEEARGKLDDTACGWQDGPEPVGDVPLGL
ncbi:hypothetical protein Micbo1qcDRAFT_233218 [Microdochium bolleyi]|uniref:Ankyrin repeat-containing domain protein n=1 Tax=Microdochium bolleyi TaxID=196109 RepID=A0A136J4F4_9PEZI|nr:hypothetical protein Micbo1qcDRAFT_233218 [Microdochium bolleyi]